MKVHRVKLINPHKNPYSVDKVVKKEQVKKSIYGVLFLIAILLCIASPILKNFTRNEDISPICDALSNLGYGVLHQPL